ncbi:hypothetical protein D8Y22_19145 [Salinadaptatus halalkaliphilus]|uniref:Uncharacterized protein n=2 Tax=Salinadaptatus halalkaliphilus TaxID=2419781 RepID=A0A4S3TH96_9EURY|nr:hypothetical protein D8Y22_19145 [Salinadaptatus halalkaliphilus]
MLWLWLLRWTHATHLPRAQLTLGFVGGLLAVYALAEARSAFARGDRLGVATTAGAAVAIALATVGYYLRFRRLYVDQSLTTVDLALGLGLVLAVTALAWNEFSETIRGCRLAVSAFAPVLLVTVAVAGAFDLLMTIDVLSGVGAVLGDLGIVGPVLAVALALVVAALVTAGLPTIAAVAIVSFPLGTALSTEFGFDAVTAHYAMLYAAVVVGVLPRPMTAVGETAAGIATDGSSRAVAGVAVALLGPMFVFPFAFLAHPELVSASPDLEAVRAWVFALVGALALTYSTTAPLARKATFGRSPRWIRAGLGTLGVLAMAAPLIPLQTLAAVGAMVVVGLVSRS